MTRATRQLSVDYTQSLEKHFRRQQWQALEELTRLAGLMPRQAHIIELYYRGAALLQLGQLDEARYCLELAQSRSPKDERIAYFLGRTLLAQGDAQASLPYLQCAYDLIPLKDSSAAAYWYVRALLDASDSEQADSVLNAALTCHPTDRQLLGLRVRRHAVETEHRRIQADPAITANRCQSLLLIDEQTVLCCGETLCSALGQSLRLVMSSPVVALQLQGVVERPLVSAKGGYRFWARFRLPVGAVITPGQQLASAFVLQIGQERFSPVRALDFRDEPWPQAAEACLAALQLHGVPLRKARRWLDAVIGPGVVALHRQALDARRRLPESPQPQLLQFGVRPDEGGAPEVSILIPLHRRWDFLPAQLSAFALDPSINCESVEVLYICVDFSIETDFLDWCQKQGHHSGLPFKVFSQSCNQGFAENINQLAHLARGEYLCLFNSDLLPCRPGWLEQLLQALRAHPEIALTTGLLLDPDGSVQHAGMEAISRPEIPGLQMTYNPGQGLSWQGGDQPQCIAMCSGALMLLERREFLDLGGFRTDFIRGDFVDSDLCLRLKQRNRGCLLVPGARLWHRDYRRTPGHSGSADLLRQWRVLTNAWLAARRSPVVPS